MAGAWVKSLHCKSRAFEDVYHPIPSCRNSVKTLKDVIETTKSKKPQKPIFKPTRIPKPEKPILSFPALSELPEGHHSRNVVEIIFHTSWTPKNFSGRVEMIFKVQTGSKTLTRFEDCRDMVRAKAAAGCPLDGGAWDENARCVADGNEMMRFYCMGDGGACGGAWSFSGAAICTFSGSGGAHERAGGGRGRRAMVVCRVIAGRVLKEKKVDPFVEGRVGFDSVSGENGELLVFDSRALLPCFLIIYKL